MRTAGFVSSAGSSKCFTSTLPSGHVHSPVAVKPMFAAFGTAAQRVFTAPSDQNGWFSAYGISRALGVSAAVLLKTPVAESVVGSGVPGAAPPRWSLKICPAVLLSWQR